MLFRFVRDNVINKTSLREETSHSQDSYAKIIVLTFCIISAGSVCVCVQMMKWIKLIVVKCAYISLV